MAPTYRAAPTGKRAGPTPGVDRARMLTTVKLSPSPFALLAGAVSTTHLHRLIGVVQHQPTEQPAVVRGSSAAVPPVAPGPVCSIVLEAERA